MNESATAAGTVAGSPRRTAIRRAFTWTLLIGGLPVLLVVLFFAMRKPSYPELTDRRLREARARWRAAGVRDYEMRLRLGERQSGEVEIEVRRGVVTKMRRDGREPRQRRTWDVWSVDGQFDMLDRELEIAADPVAEAGAAPGTRLLLQVEFHGELGYPVHFRRLVLGSGLPDVAWDVTAMRIGP